MLYITISLKYAEASFLKNKFSLPKDKSCVSIPMCLVY